MSARLAQAATQQSPQCEPVPPQSDGAGLASSSRPNYNVQEAAIATPTERGHGLRSQPGHTRLGRCPIGRGPQSTFPRQRPVHRVNVEKFQVTERSSVTPPRRGGTPPPDSPPLRDYPTALDNTLKPSHTRLRTIGHPYTPRTAPCNSSVTPPWRGELPPICPPHSETTPRP